MFNHYNLESSPKKGIFLVTRTFHKQRNGICSITMAGISIFYLKNYYHINFCPFFTHNLIGGEFILLICIKFDLELINDLCIANTNTFEI